MYLQLPLQKLCCRKKFITKYKAVIAAAATLAKPERMQLQLAWHMAFENLTTLKFTSDLSSIFIFGLNLPKHSKAMIKVLSTGGSDKIK